MSNCEYSTAALSLHRSLKKPPLEEVLAKITLRVLKKDYTIDVEETNRRRMHIIRQYHLHPVYTSEEVDAFRIIQRDEGIISLRYTLFMPTHLETLTKYDYIFPRIAADYLGVALEEIDRLVAVKELQTHRKPDHILLTAVNKLKYQF